MECACEFDGREEQGREIVNCQGEAWQEMVLQREGSTGEFWGLSFDQSLFKEENVAVRNIYCKA